MMRGAWTVLPLILIGVFACRDQAVDPTGEPTRVSLENGGTLVRYAELPEPTHAPLEPNLVLGASDDPELLFGNVRSVDALGDGSVYVLDFQAVEVRAFDAEGRFQGVVVSRGEGPGEMTEANGMVFVGDSVLWLQDYGKWQMLGVRPDGSEVTRFPMHVLTYGYSWEGTVDEKGRVWKRATHSDDPPAFPPEVGLTDGTARLYMNSYDPRTGESDSIFVGNQRFRSFVQQQGRGYSHWGIPFDPLSVTIADRSGNVWHTEADTYRVVRMNERGDTVLVLEAATSRLPVTPEDRASFVSEQGERGPAARSGAEAVADLMGDTKPALSAIVADDVGRLWVQRTGQEGAPPRYDVFSDGGDFLGSVALGFQPLSYVPIRIRNGNLYAVVRDSLDVQTVVRAAVPALTRSAVSHPSTPRQ